MKSIYLTILLILILTFLFFLTIHEIRKLKYFSKVLFEINTTQKKQVDFFTDENQENKERNNNISIKSNILDSIKNNNEIRLDYSQDNIQKSDWIYHNSIHRDYKGLNIILGDISKLYSKLEWKDQLEPIIYLKQNNFKSIDSINYSMLVLNNKLIDNYEFFAFYENGDTITNYQCVKKNKKIEGKTTNLVTGESKIIIETNIKNLFNDLNL